MSKKNNLFKNVSTPIRAKLIFISSVFIILTLGIATVLEIGINKENIISIAKENIIKANRHIAMEISYNNPLITAQYPTFVINTDGTLIWDWNNFFIENGINTAHLDFIQTILNGSERNGHLLIESDFGNLKIRSEPEDFDLRVWEKIKSTFELYINKAKSFLAKYDIITLEPKKEKLINAFAAFIKLDNLNAVVITCMDLDDIYKDVFALIRRNIYIAIGMIIIASVFLSMLSYSFTNPLSSLFLTAKQIEDGQFSQKINVKNKDEIGILASEYKKMCAALQAFFKFTNREIAVKTARGDLKPGGVTKHGSILFSKVRDMNSRLEHFSQVFGFESSGKVINWLNNYFSQVIDCVEKADGVMDNFAGDAVIAHWGVAGSAGSPRKDAFNCVKAALMMRKAVFFLNKERKAGDPENPALYFGCGVNSGTVAAGQLGNGKFMTYSAVGTAVDIAKEMEELAMQNGVDILISEDTWRLVGDLFLTDEFPAVKVKGREKPVRLFAVINFTGELKGPQNIDELRSILNIEAPVVDLEEL